MIEVTTTESVYCMNCDGTGVVPRYLDYTKGCEACRGKGVKEVIMPITFAELCIAIDDELRGEKVLPSSYLRAQHLYTRWREAGGK